MKKIDLIPVFIAMTTINKKVVVNTVKYGEHYMMTIDGPGGPIISAESYKECKEQFKKAFDVYNALKTFMFFNEHNCLPFTKYSLEFGEPIEHHIAI